jgi:hypothetical protein
MPLAPAKPTPASLPITCAQTMVSASTCVGFTLPGMMDEPGSFSGRTSSPQPAARPEPSRRMSFAILNRLTATTRSAPDISTSASFAARPRTCWAR